MTVRPETFDEPEAVAAAVAECPRPLLIATDVDGTLSPIVATPTAAYLLHGVAILLGDLAAIDGVDVAAVSGRSLAELTDHFGLPPQLHLVGSHGAEAEHAAPPDESERAALHEATEALGHIVTAVHGARLEHKPLAVALHVRACTPAAADEALNRARQVFGGRVDLTVHEGHAVYEVAVRASTKAAALLALRNQLQPSAVVFLGDDTSDETAFETLRPPDIGVKVGPGPTAAGWRLAAPQQVVHALTTLLAELRRPAG